MNKLYLFFFLLIILGFAPSHAQSPQLQLQKQISPYAHNTLGQVMYGISKVNSGGYILVGSDTTYFFDKSGFLNKEFSGEPLITRTDNEGNVIWSNRLRPYYFEGFYSSVAQTGSGDFITAGYGHQYIYSTNTNINDLIVSRYRNDGTLKWYKGFGGSKLEYAQCMIQAKDGNYVAAGYTNSNDGNVSGNHGTGTYDFWVIKLDTSGNLLWQKCYGGTGEEKAYSIQQTYDGGYIVAGKDSSSNGDVTVYKGASDGWIIKLDSNGNLQWQKSIGGTGSDVFKSVLQTSDGGYILTGYTYSSDIDVSGNHGNADVWVVRLDATGNLLWQKCFGGSNEEYGAVIEQAVDKGFLVSGHTLSTNGDVSMINGGADAWLIKIDANGALVWQNTFGTAKDEYSNSVKEISENEFLIGVVSKNVPPLYPSDASDIFFYKAGNLNTIKGTLFIDNNFNGVKDAGEAFYSNATVKSEKVNDIKTTTPVNGAFKVIVDTGTYRTTVVSNNPYYKVGPSFYNSTFSSYFNTDSISFSLQPIANQRDLSINILPVTPSRPGFPVQYRVFYKNSGTDTIVSGTVQFVKSSKLTVVSTLPAYTAINGDTLKWNYTNLKPEDTASIALNFTVQAPPSVNIGDKLTSIATITPVATDLTPSDDTSVLVQTVIGAYDPNDKKESHAGTLIQQQVTKGEWLVYTVHFQNTGTDTAFNVVVRDTLTNKVNWNSLQMINSSHRYQLSIKDGNKCTWSFNDIKLVDSLRNEPASRGYITFRIKSNSNLLGGDTIKNSAGIYFDYNLPIPTNTERTVIESVVLPIKLISFTVSHNGGNNLLQWQTTQQENFDYFEVEKSVNGRDFLSIGKIIANDRGKYNVSDDHPAKAINYYRLKMVDKDGKIDYSSVRSLDNSSGLNLNIYPNPVKDKLSVKVNTDAKRNLLLEVIGLDGKVLLTKRVVVSTGSLITTLSISTLSAGDYFLRVSATDKNQLALKFEKL